MPFTFKMGMISACFRVFRNKAPLMMAQMYGIFWEIYDFKKVASGVWLIVQDAETFYSRW